MSNQITTAEGHSLAERRRHLSPEDGNAIGPGAYSTQLDGSRFSQFIRDNIRLFIGILALALGVAAVLTLRQEPVYETKASVLLDQRKKQVVQGLEDVVSPLPPDSSVVDTEVELLSSSGMAFQVARSAGLIPNVAPDRMSADQQQEASEVIRNILEHRTISRVGLTYLIDIRYASADPQMAQRMANLYAQTYLASQVGVRVDEDERVRKHLQAEVARLQAQVTSADAAAATYKARHALNGNTPLGTLTEQEISSYNQTLALARAQAAEDAQRLSAARSQVAKGNDSLGDFNSASMQQLRAQQGLASALVAQLSSRYGPNHPELVTARKQLEDINRLIAGENSRVVSGLQAQAQASSGRAAEVAAKLSSTEGQLAQSDKAAVKLR